ncbi:MAG: DUF92 domain-containing protein [Chloroflexi bacterium]|jgi:uncharacterized protein (TIGR00297 family)|nr:DUF92 domain-containing protein [Chloroflexota bacterium]
MIDPIRLLTGAVLALVISVLAYRARSLNRSGALAATLLGTVVFGLGGLAWAVLLIGFFVSSSALSRLSAGRKRSLNEKFSKGSQRDAGQVLANGAVAGLCVLLQLLFPGQAWPWLAFAGSLAAVNADTWGTELGVLSRTSPVLITTGRPVERGTSGGISLAGTLAALGGGLFIALLALLFDPAPGLAWGVLPVVGLAGLLGSLVDSALGATVQAIYVCPACNKETERHPLHTCGTPTQWIRGWRWMDNDWVNITCALAGGAAAALLGSGLGWF